MLSITLILWSNFLIVFGLLHSAHASFAQAVELTEASKNSLESKSYLEAGEKTIKNSPPLVHQQNIMLEMSQPSINNSPCEMNLNKPSDEKNQGNEMKNKNSLNHPIFQQAQPVQNNPIGDPYLSYLHHSVGGYMQSYDLGAHDIASLYTSYAPQAAIPESFLAQSSLATNLIYAGPVVIPTVYDSYYYGYHQNYFNLPFAQSFPNTDLSLQGLENFGHLKDTRVCRDDSVQGEFLNIPPGYWRPCNEAESRLFPKQPIPSKSDFSSDAKTISKVRISKPSMKERSKALNEPHASESSKETHGVVKKGKSNQYLQTDKKQNNYLHSKEKKKVDDVDETLNTQPKHHVLKTTSTTKEIENENQIENRLKPNELNIDPIGASSQNLNYDKGKLTLAQTLSKLDQVDANNHVGEVFKATPPVKNTKASIERNLQEAFKDEILSSPKSQNENDKEKPDSPNSQEMRSIAKVKDVKISKSVASLVKKGRVSSHPNQKVPQKEDVERNNFLYIKKDIGRSETDLISQMITNYEEALLTNKDQYSLKENSNQIKKLENVPQETSKITSEILNVKQRMPKSHATNFNTKENSAADLSKIQRSPENQTQSEKFEQNLYSNFYLNNYLDNSDNQNAKKPNFSPVEKKTLPVNRKNTNTNMQLDSLNNKAQQNNQDLQGKQATQNSYNKQLNSIKYERKKNYHPNTIKEGNKIKSKEELVDETRGSTENKHYQISFPTNSNSNTLDTASNEAISKNQKITEPAKKLEVKALKPNIGPDNLEMAKENKGGEKTSTNTFENKASRTTINIVSKIDNNPKKSRKGKKNTSKQSLKESSDFLLSENELKVKAPNAKINNGEKIKLSSTFENFINEKQDLENKNFISICKDVQNSTCSKKNKKKHPRDTAIHLIVNDNRKLDENDKDSLTIFKEANHLLGTDKALRLNLQDFPRRTNLIIIELAKMLDVENKEKYLTLKNLDKDFHYIQSIASSEPVKLNNAIIWLRFAISDSKILVEREKEFNKLFFNWLAHKINKEQNGEKNLGRLSAAVVSHPLYKGI